MSWTCSGTTNAELIANLMKESSRIIPSGSRVGPVSALLFGSLPSFLCSDAYVFNLKAMEKVDRANYVLHKADAYRDSPQYGFLL
jgi:hypothetical protein